MSRILNFTLKIYFVFFFAVTKQNKKIKYHLMICLCFYQYDPLDALNQESVTRGPISECNKHKDIKNGYNNAHKMQ